MRRNKILILTMIMLTAGCYYDKEENLYPMNSLPELVTYTDHIRPITESQCAITGCHVQGNNLPVLDTYTGVKSVASSGALKIRVIDERTMPPGKPLTNNEQDLIQKWIDTGLNE